MGLIPALGRHCSNVESHRRWLCHQHFSRMRHSTFKDCWKTSRKIGKRRIVPSKPYNDAICRRLWTRDSYQTRLATTTARNRSATRLLASQARRKRNIVHRCTVSAQRSHSFPERRHKLLSRLFWRCLFENSTSSLGLRISKITRRKTSSFGISRINYPI